MSFWSWSLVPSLLQYSRMFFLRLTNHCTQHVLRFSITSTLSSKNGLFWIYKKPRWRWPSCETQGFKTIVHSGFILGWDKNTSIITWLKRIKVFFDLNVAGPHLYECSSIISKHLSDIFKRETPIDFFWSLEPLVVGKNTPWQTAQQNTRHEVTPQLASVNMESWPPWIIQYLSLYVEMTTLILARTGNGVAISNDWEFR